MAQEVNHRPIVGARQYASEVRILVTGGGGLVGKALQWAVDDSENMHFTKRPDERWIFLTSADGDLRDMTSARSIFERWRPNVIVHLAARVGGVFANMAQQADFLNDNLSINQNVLRLCHEYDVKKVISCLSTCIFPDKTPYPIDETMLHNGPPHNSNFGYAYAKRMLDVASRAYASQYGRKFTGIIPTNIYGPYDNFGDGSHFVPAMIRKVQAAKDSGANSLQVAGSGAALRQFIYSRDIAQILVWMAREYDSPDPLILAGDKDSEMSIKNAVSTVCKLSDFSGQIEWDTTKTDGQLRKTADNTKLKAYLKDFKFTSFEQGVRETIAWFVQNKDSSECRL
ncbi:GDP-L-fucose synthase [Xylariales sp. AK1849]|nr:GDP-L-fucose synthase [Xylariales sp. AK1849]